MGFGEQDDAQQVGIFHLGIGKVKDREQGIFGKHVCVIHHQDRNLVLMMQFCDLGVEHFLQLATVMGQLLQTESLCNLEH